MPNKRLTQEEFVARCHAVHGNRYDLSKVVYVRLMSDIEVICAAHGSFFPRAGNFINRGSGCKKCGLEASGVLSRNDESVFVARFVKAHGDRFSYNGIFYEGAKPYVRVVCPHHGEFHQLANDHARGIGCEKCSKPIRDLESFTLAAREVHGDKYDYSSVEYASPTKPVWIACPIHGKFKQGPTYHVHAGHGCRQCSIGGFNPGKPAAVYVYRLTGASGGYIGFGVTNNFKKRDVSHRFRTSRAGFSLELVKVFNFEVGEDAWAVEKLIKASVEIVNLGVSGFKTEAANESSLPEILRILNAA